jgi:enoyl-CoA hydratase/carnithine racemase
MSAIHRSDHSNGVAVLTFDQPGRKANVLTRELWIEFRNAIEQLSKDSEVRGLVLASAKPGIFIAGADLKFFAGVPAPNDPQVAELIRFGLDTLDLLESLPFPTCAAIDGAALGGGLEVALACDSRLLGTNPRVELGLPETKLGLIPGWGGTQRLSRIAGMELAYEMLAHGRSAKAAEACEKGLASATVQSSELIDFAARHVLHEGWQELRSMKRGPVAIHESERFQATVPSSPEAVREAMLLLNRGVELPLAEALNLETEAFLRLAGSEESKAKIAAFFARKS